MAFPSSNFSPKQIAEAEFPTTFRGYETEAVRAYLQDVADTMAQIRERGERGSSNRNEKLLKQQLVEMKRENSNLKRRVSSLESQPPPALVQEPQQVVDLTEDQIASALGREATKILESARTAAADIVERAHDEAADIAESAEIEAAKVKGQADKVLEVKRAEATKDAETTIAAAEKQASQIKLAAKADYDKVKAEVQKIMAEAKTVLQRQESTSKKRADRLVVDAEKYREKVVSELIEQRRTGATELEALLETRDQLAATLADARSHFEALTVDLRTVETSPLKTRDHLEFAEELEATLKDLDEGLAEASEASTLADLEDDLSDLSLDEFDLDSSKVNVQFADVDKESDFSIEESDFGFDELEQHIADDVDAFADTDFGDQDLDFQEAHDDLDLSELEGVGADDGYDVDDDFEFDEFEVELEFEELDDSTVSDYDDLIDTTTNSGRGSGATRSSQIDLTDDLTSIDLRESKRVREREMAAVREASNRYAPDSVGASKSGGRDRSGGGGSRADLWDDDPAMSTGEVPVTFAETDPVYVDQGGFYESSEMDSGHDSFAEDWDEVLSTVSARAYGTVPDQTRGDLPTGESLTGPLPELFKERDLILSRLGPELRRKIKRTLNDDQSDVLERLRRGRGPMKPDELPALEAQVEHYFMPLADTLAAVMSAAAAPFGVEIPDSLVDHTTGQLAKHIVVSVRIPTIEIVERADGSSRDNVMDPIRNVYREFRNNSLTSLLEDALFEMYAVGHYVAIPAEAEAVWLLDPRLEPDPLCEINARTRGLRAGEIFPSGHARPLSLPGCRCMLTIASD